MGPCPSFLATHQLFPVQVSDRLSLLTLMSDQHRKLETKQKWLCVSRLQLAAAATRLSSRRRVLVELARKTTVLESQNFSASDVLQKSHYVTMHGTVLTAVTSMIIPV